MHDVGEPVGSYAYDVVADAWTWGAAVYEIHGMRPLEGVPSTQTILERVHPSDRATTWEHFQRHLRQAGPYSCSYRILDPAGHLHTVVYVGEAFATDGRVTRLEGYVVDISAPVAQTATIAVLASATHRAAIEQVKGALMLTYGVDENVAFTLLRGYSNNKNLRLATLARRMADRLDSPQYRELGAPQTLLAILEDVSRSDAVAAPELISACDRLVAHVTNADPSGRISPGEGGYARGMASSASNSVGRAASIPAAVGPRGADQPF